jgi:hypothetical protein
MLQKKFAEKNTLSCSITFPSPKMVPFIEIMWKNVVLPERPQMTI